MINRNEVAREKMQRAAEMLQDNNIDMWVFYARLKTDTALELMFNTDSNVFADEKRGQNCDCNRCGYQSI